MFDKLENVEKRYEELNQKISDPEVIANQSEWQKLMKEHADIQDLVEKYREYKKVSTAIEELKEMLDDKEMHDLAQMELDENREKLPKIEEELKLLLVPKDPNDDKTLSLKSVVALVEKNLHYLQETYLECIACMLKRNVGN